MIEHIVNKLYESDGILHFFGRMFHSLVSLAGVKMH